MRLLLIATVALILPACASSPTVMAPPSDPYPGAPERILDKEACPDADPDGEGLLHDPEDGSAGAIVEARKQDGEMYLRCRAAFHSLVDHERERLRRQRERAMEGAEE